MDVYSCSSIFRLVGFFLSSIRAEPLATVEAAVSQLGDARGAAERQQSFVQAARDAAESTAMRLALERASMQCEDMLSASCNT